MNSKLEQNKEEAARLFQQIPGCPNDGGGRRLCAFLASLQIVTENVAQLNDSANLIDRVMEILDIHSGIPDTEGGMPARGDWLSLFATLCHMRVIVISDQGDLLIFDPDTNDSRVTDFWDIIGTSGEVYELFRKFNEQRNKYKYPIIIKWHKGVHFEAPMNLTTCIAGQIAECANKGILLRRKRDEANVRRREAENDQDLEKALAASRVTAEMESAERARHENSMTKEERDILSAIEESRKSARKESDFERDIRLATKESLQFKSSIPPPRKETPYEREMRLAMEASLKSAQEDEDLQAATKASLNSSRRANPSGRVSELRKKFEKK